MMSLNSLMVHTVAIQQQTQTRSNYAGVVHTWTTRGGSEEVPCRVQQLSGDALLAFGKLGHSEAVRVYFDRDPQVTIANAILFDGKSYQVKTVYNVVDRLWQVDAALVPTR